MKGDNNILDIYSYTQKAGVLFSLSVSAPSFFARVKLPSPILLNFITHLCVPNQHGVYKIKALCFICWLTWVWN